MCPNAEQLLLACCLLIPYLGELLLGSHVLNLLSLPMYERRRSVNIWFRVVNLRADYLFVKMCFNNVTVMEAVNFYTHVANSIPIVKMI